MQCNHCWYNKRWKDANIKSQNLSYDELDKISRSIDNIHFLSMTGGEAFLREDIVEISSLFAKNSGLKRYDIPTAGWDTDLIVQKTEQMLNVNKNIPFRVDISIDGVEELHDEIRNKKDAFNNAVNTINSLKTLKKKFNHFEISIITTISNKNQNDVERIYKLVKDILPDGEWFINAARDITADSNSKLFDISAYKKAIDLNYDFIESQNYSNKKANPKLKLITAKNIVRNNIILNQLKGGKYKGACAAASLIGVIFNDGTVKPCETLSDEIANIRDFNYDLKALWNSTQAKNIRKKIIDSKCNCTHECFLSVSIPCSPVSLMKLLYERSKL